jgi:hypothetical protein
MSFRRGSSLGTLAGNWNRLFKGRSRRLARHRARRQFFEQLESRELMALNILSVSPLDGATEVPVDTNLTINFNENVAKGQGNIYVLQKSTNTLGVSVDVRSSNVSVSGSQVTIDLPVDLLLDNSYYVMIDDGAFIDTSSNPTSDATLLTQNFDYLPLGPQVFETAGNGVNDWTATPPDGFVSELNNPAMAGVGLPEWRGWTFARKAFWQNVDPQNRDEFQLGSGTVAVADTDEYDDGNGAVRPFQSTLYTKPVDLTGVAPNSIQLEFDSSFRPENSQIARLGVSFDGGATFTQLLELNPSNTDNDAPWARGNMNETLVTGGTTGGGVPIGAVNNPSSGSLVFSYYIDGSNDWWWALDNLKITGDIVGVPFGGISDPLFWEFSTPVPLGFAVTLDKAFMSENGGTAIGTVSRTANDVSGEVIVTLSSNDTTEATVPATVTIPSGVRSATFAITAVDDLLFDRTQSVVISASATSYITGTAIIKVTDDEGPDATSLFPADNATDVFFRTNLLVDFSTNVKKGSGRVHIIETSTGVLGETIDINSANVTISGSTVTINPSADLKLETNYHVLFDDGAILDTSSTVVPNTVLLTETFDLLPLGPFTLESGGDGTDFTKTPPLGFAVDNSLMPGGSASEFDGWSFMDKNSWINASDDKSGTVFTRGSGTVAVADPEEWSDQPRNEGFFNSFLVTAPIDLSTVAAGSVSIEFDSSFRRAGSFAFGTVEVSYNNGTSWSPFLFFGSASNPNDGRNERIVASSANTAGQLIGAATVESALNSPASGQMRFRFGMQFGDAANTWWALDNLVIRGQRVGEPYAGIEDPTAWNFQTGNLPVLSMTADQLSISENGGTATGTIFRSQTTQGDLIVTLTSSDTTELTVPATVTIPDGASSVTFPITAVDDALLDVTQTVTITATATDFVTATLQIDVTDDEFGIVAISPLPGATEVPVDSNFTVAFNQNIRKGNGFIHLVRQSDGKLGASIDVHSSAVTISGDTMTINFPEDLVGQTGYYGLLDPGVVLTTQLQTTPGTVLLTQDFELLPLRPAVLETVGVTPNGKDFTDVAPSGWARDNTQMPPGGAPEWTGFTFADKGFWATQGGQARGNFSRGNGTIAVGDTDEWDDYARPTNAFVAFLSTNPIQLDSVEPNSVVLEFDSSFRPENSQIGTLDVSYDGGSSWNEILRLDPTNTSNASTSANINERRSIAVDNPNTGSMQFRFGVNGANDWWWAIDNILVTGTTVNFPHPGLLDSSVYTITTAEAKTLSVSLPESAAENAGTVLGTVSRNLGTVGDVLVTLTSSNPSVGTVPATVTIPSGQASASFVVTILDDSYFDGTQPLTVTATADGFVAGNDLIAISDNESGDIVITEIMYNPSGGANQEQRNEWVEVYNRGATTIDLSGWRLNDKEVQDWGRIASGSLLAPGEVAVIYNAFFGLNTETLVRTEWSIPASAKVFGSAWSMKDDGTNRQRGGLFNSPSLGSVILTLQDASNNNLDLVDFARDGVIWPASPEGASIYLTDVTADSNVGTNWATSVVGVDGAVNSVGPTFLVADRGSPGFVPSDNQAPVLTVSSNTVAGNVLSTLTNTGTWTDDPADVVTLTASLGVVTKNGDGTWSWSFIPGQAYSSQSVTITATDDKGGSSQVAFTIDALVAVVSRSVFYNGSGFETVGGVGAALDASKILLRSSSVAQATTAANVINYSRGINGVVLDVAGLAGSGLSASDFLFRVAPSGASGVVNPSTWASAPTPNLIDVTPGTSTTPARVRLEWANNAIQNTWLQIIVLANANTGLANREVYYLGHSLGDVDYVGPTYRVTTNDVALVRAGVSSTPVGISDARDVDKDRRVTTNDVAFVRGLVSNTPQLRAITIPASGSSEEGEGGTGGLMAAPGVVLPQSGVEGVRPIEIKARMTGSNYDVPLPAGRPSVDAVWQAVGAVDSVGTDGEWADDDVEAMSLDAYFVEMSLKKFRSPIVR